MPLDNAARRFVEGREVKRRPAPAAENDNLRVSVRDTLARYPKILARLRAEEGRARQMTGFIAGLTPAQREEAISYRGPDTPSSHEADEPDAYEARHDREASRADWKYQFRKEQEVA